MKDFREPSNIGGWSFIWMFLKSISQRLDTDQIPEMDPINGIHLHRTMNAMLVPLVRLRNKVVLKFHL
jgi:hypothetical protein